MIQALGTALAGYTARGDDIERWRTAFVANARRRI